MKDDKTSIEIVRILRQTGYKAYYAGGCVRDMILGFESNDIDIATAATPDQIQCIPAITNNYSIKEVGKNFGVLILKKHGEEMSYEVATFRNDGAYFSDGRHPDSIKFGNIQEDAERRDLTINALYWDPISQTIIDLVNGQKDVEDKIIRFVGEPERRIQEDHLRILRAYRFAGKLKGFHFDSHSRKAMKRNAHLLQKLPAERIAEELTKILKQCDPDIFEYLLLDSILIYTIPEMIPMRDCLQSRRFHPEGDVWNHTLLIVKEMQKISKDPIDLWAALLHDIGKPGTQEWSNEKSRYTFNGHDNIGSQIATFILTRLRFPNNFIKSVASLIGNHMRMASVKKMRKAKIRRLMADPLFNNHCNLHVADCNSSHGDLENIHFLKKINLDSLPNKKLDLPKPLINGFDLMILGIKPGPEFKEILNDVMDEQLEGRVKTKIEGTQYVEEKYKKYLPNKER